MGGADHRKSYGHHLMTSRVSQLEVWPYDTKFQPQNQILRYFDKHDKHIVFQDFDDDMNPISIDASHISRLASHILMLAFLEAGLWWARLVSAGLCWATWRSWRSLAGREPNSVRPPDTLSVHQYKLSPYFFG